MMHRLEDPDLKRWAETIEGLRWAGFVLDGEFRLAWVSNEIRLFLASPSDEDLGLGLYVIGAMTKPAWRRVATDESQARFFMDVVPVLLEDARERGIDIGSVLPDDLVPLLEQIEPEPMPSALATSFDYLDPYGDSDLPVYTVNVLLIPQRDEQGSRRAVVGFCYMSLRPGLVSLLARGDEAMYERMAKLIEPQSREAAILLCDLESSTELARTLPTAGYFRLIRDLWTGIDKTVAANQGIIGKHAGDGASAFFLVDDLGSPSAAAAAAIRTARAIHERSADTFSEALESPCMMRVGLHWGSSIYIGQLVPGNRLDVTALGDGVNECSRIQECADTHETLASKDLIERLTDVDAAELGLDPEKIRYRLLSDFSAAPQKVARDAGTVAVTPV